MTKIKEIDYDENLIVFYKGEPKYLINPDLLNQQKAWNNLDKIKALHETKLAIHDEILKTDDKELLKQYVSDLTMLEFELQKQWGFKEDENFHRFWNTPKCKCPVMDNEDNYPIGIYYRSRACPLHG